jgi:formylglycine-generating enzyme required for sulfatase activity
MPRSDGKYKVVVDAAKGLYREVHPLIRNMKDGSVLALVPGGVFEMGDGKDKNCPKHIVYLDSYYIGVYCVTNAQYAAFVKATGHRAPELADYGTPVWANGQCPEEKLHQPVVCVNWDDATAYAEWAGCELATEAQWEKASRGPRNLIHPWDNDWDAGKCRNNTNRDSEQTCAVWEYAMGTSGYGTYNQSGNVWEWCRDLYGEYVTAGVQKNPVGIAKGPSCDRGGSWRIDVASRFRGADRSRCHPPFFCDDLGFRLVRTV